MPIASVEIKSIAGDYTTGLALRFFRSQEIGRSLLETRARSPAKIEGRDRDLLS